MGWPFAISTRDGIDWADSWADPLAHRAACVASDLSERTAHGARAMGSTSRAGRSVAVRAGPERDGAIATVEAR